MRALPLLLRALLAQSLAAAGAVLALKAGMAAEWASRAALAAGLDGALAMVFSRLLSLPVWWLPIQGLFVPAVLVSRRLELPPSAWLAGFLLLWLIFRRTLPERVPLYLTDHRTWQALAGLLPGGAFHFLDLGCGFGGGLAYLSGRFPAAEFHGLEAAPLPYLFGRMRLRGKANCRIRLRDFWQEDLGRYDVVYAFLSPAPMAKLWNKAKREMRPGALLVSNGFEVPGVAADGVVPTASGARLLVWRM